VRRVLVFLMIFGCARFGYAQVAGQDYEKLKKEYEKVLAERDNLSIQVRKLLEFKNQAASADQTIALLRTENEKMKEQIKLLETQARLHHKQTADEVAKVKESSAETEIKYKELMQQRDQLNNSLEKLEIEYKIVPETKRQMSRLEAENKQLKQNNRDLQQSFKKIETEKLDFYAQLEIYRRQVRDLKKQYEEAMVKNRQLEKTAQELPVKFAELARENKVLIKETALMHYNLGVFYTKNKEYARATAEFEKAIELNPDDPYAYYNLGYIYAEYAVDRPRAVDNFRKFLSLIKTDDKDADWVKKYILTWQTWDAKKPVQ